MHRAILRFLDAGSSFFFALGCLATLMMMIHVSGDVLSRLLFKFPIPATLELVTYIYMAGVCFLPMAMVQRRRQQIVVEVFGQLIPRRGLAAMDGVLGVAGFAFMLALAWFNAQEAWAQTLIEETAPSMSYPVPIWPARWMVVGGALLTAGYLAVHAVEDLCGAWTGRLPERTSDFPEVA